MRRKQCPRLKIDQRSVEAGQAEIGIVLAPELIAKWLKQEYPEHSMSGKTYIYDRNYRVPLNIKDTPKLSNIGSNEAKHYILEKCN